MTKREWFQGTRVRTFQREIVWKSGVHLFPSEPLLPLLLLPLALPLELELLPLLLLFQLCLELFVPGKYFFQHTFHDALDNALSLTLLARSAPEPTPEPLATLCQQAAQVPLLIHPALALIDVRIHRIADALLAFHRFKAVQVDETVLLQSPDACQRRNFPQDDVHGQQPALLGRTRGCRGFRWASCLRASRVPRQRLLLPLLHL